MLLAERTDTAKLFRHPSGMSDRPLQTSNKMGVPYAWEILGRNLKALMDLRGWNQVELARRSGVSQRHISSILNRRTGVSGEIIDKLAYAFGRKGFELQVDGLHEEILSSTGNLSSLVSAYVHDPTSRKLLDAALELLPKPKRR